MITGSVSIACFSVLVYGVEISLLCLHLCHDQIWVKVQSTQSTMQIENKYNSEIMWHYWSTFIFPCLSDVYLLFLLDWVYGSLCVQHKEKKAWQWAVCLQWNLWPGVHRPGGSWSTGVHELLGPEPLPRRQQAKPLQAQTPHTGFRLLRLPPASRTSRALKGLCVPLLPGKSLIII